MTRPFRLALAVCVLACGAGRLSADEIKGKVKGVDLEKGTITLTVGDAERTLNVAADAKVVGLFGKKLKKAVTQDVPGGLRSVKEGEAVTLTADQGVVSQVKLTDLQAKVKKKKKAKAKTL